MSDTFQTVENLFNSVMSITADCYNTIIERIENTLSYLNNLFEDITQNKQTNLLNIINIIKNDVNIFINDHQNDANNIYEVAKIFYQEIEEKIKNRLKEKELNNDNTPFNFDIATFYDIQDIYKKVINILSSFKERIENAIAVENLTFYNEVYNKFDEILDTPLKNVELISYNARNNASVIDAMREFLGEEEGDRRRELLISRINSLRVTINNMITEIFKKIKDTYDSELLKSETFKTITNNLNNYANEIKANQTS